MFERIKILTIAKCKKSSAFLWIACLVPTKMLQEFFCGLFQSANLHGKNIVKPLENLADLACKYAKENKSQLGQGLCS